VVDISVDRAGTVYLDKKPVTDRQLSTGLLVARHASSDLRVIISGDRRSFHGDIIHVLDLVRGAGIEKVAFEISPESKVNEP